MSDRDDENPNVERPSRRVLAVFKDPEPGFATTVISVASNFILSNMFLYGITGNGRMSYLASIVTVPVSVYLCVRDQMQDYEKWKELRVLRLKGVPDRFMPYKSKYDWTEYEQRETRRLRSTDH